MIWNPFKKKEMKRYIVYITTQYYWNLYHIGQPYSCPPETDLATWECQKRILELAEKYQNHKFIIKLYTTHTDKEPLKSYVRDHNIKNVQLIAAEKTVVDVLGNAEIVIIDTVLTTILQVFAATDARVYVYAGLYKMNREPLEILRRRAWVYEDLDDWIAGVESYLCTHDPSVGVKKCVL
jgi:hypothetical protein